MSDLSLSKAVRSNLLSLQSTAASMAKTQTRLATGLKVNTALDNPTNFFTAASLNGRAGDMSNLLDSMSSGIKTIEAADNGLKSITKTVESMQSTLRQARQDKSFQSATIDYETPAVASNRQIGLTSDVLGPSEVAIEATQVKASEVMASQYMNLDLSGASLDFSLQVESASHSVSVSSSSATSLQVDVDGTTTSFAVADRNSVTIDEISGALTAGLRAVGLDVSVKDQGGFVAFETDWVPYDAFPLVVGIPSSGATAVPFGYTALPTYDVQERFTPVDQLVSSINADPALSGAVRASNDGGKLRIENLTNEDLTVGVPAGGSGQSVTIEGNDVRKNLVKQFNDLRDQLDKFADDASFNGINLLRGDKLKLTFNETGSSTIEVQAEDEDGAPTSVNTASLGIEEASNADFASDASLDAMLDTMKGALDDLRSQSSSFGSNLSVVENRNEFTKSMINTLETGAANLTLADTNQEAANLLALQTRQQLSSTALSMASQADQAVLRLF